MCVCVFQKLWQEKIVEISGTKRNLTEIEILFKDYWEFSENCGMKQKVL